MSFVEEKETRRFCPRCESEKIKSELKLLPNKFLTCARCQAFFRVVANQLFQVVL